MNAPAPPGCVPASSARLAVRPPGTGELARGGGAWVVGPRESPPRGVWRAARRWEAHHDEEGNEYYYNTSSGVSTYEHPMDNQFRQMYRQRKDAKLKALGASPPAARNGAATAANEGNPSGAAAVGSGVASSPPQHDIY